MKQLRLPLILWAILLTVSATLLSSAATAESLENGPAPDFRLQDQYGDWHELADYQGRWLVLYFYPRDDTPGCTEEACNFRDNIYAYRKLGAEIVGVSLDSVESHKKFSAKYRLPFTILADTDGQTARAYGVLRNLKLVKLAKRQSFIIDPEGRVVKHYGKVDTAAHSEQVLADLRAFQSQSDNGSRG